MVLAGVAFEKVGFLVCDSLGEYRESKPEECCAGGVEKKGYLKMKPTRSSLIEEVKFSRKLRFDAEEKTTSEEDGNRSESHEEGHGRPTSLRRSYLVFGAVDNIPHFEKLVEPKPSSD